MPLQDHKASEESGLSPWAASGPLGDMFGTCIIPRRCSYIAYEIRWKIFDCAGDGSGPQSSPAVGAGGVGGPEIESHYWWKGKVESGTEALLIMKTSRDRLAALERLVVEKHPYDTPEFLVAPLAAGNRRYLKWICDSVAGEGKVIKN
jgi:CutA1 divalent ion tolerance protein